MKRSEYAPKIPLQRTRLRDAIRYRQGRRPLHAAQPAPSCARAALQVGLTSGIIPEIPVRQPVVVL